MSFGLSSRIHGIDFSEYSGNVNVAYVPIKGSAPDIGAMTKYLAKYEQLQCNISSMISQFGLVQLSQQKQGQYVFLHTFSSPYLMIKRG